MLSKEDSKKRGEIKFLTHEKRFEVNEIMEYNESQLKIIEFLKNFGKMTAQELSEKTGIPKTTVIQNIYKINGKNCRGTKKERDVEPLIVKDKIESGMRGRPPTVFWIPIKT